MLSDAGRRAREDILYHIDLAASFVEGFSYESFADDLRTFHAVTRCLEIISEASRRVPRSVKAAYPAIRWEQMAAAGNRYRHEYEDVAQQVVWDTVRLSLPALRMVVTTALAPDDGTSKSSV